MKCHNYKDCNRSLEKVMIKVQKEIVKVDRILQNCENDSVLTCHKLSKSEKRQIFNSVKANSRENCLFVEELRMHRAEVKYMLKAFNNLLQKHENLQIIRQRQLEKIKSIHCRIKNELAPIIKSRESEEKVVPSIRETQKQENEELERTYENMMTQFATLSAEYKEETNRISTSYKYKVEEYKRNKTLFSLVAKSIRQAFYIRAQIESKQANFIDYAFPESQADSTEENSDCCCHEE